MDRRLFPADRVDLLLDCETIDGAWALHVQQMAEYGFDRLLYAATRFRTHGLIGDPADLMILSNHHPDVVNGLFGDQHLYLDVPRNDWTGLDAAAFSWRKLSEFVTRNDLTDREQAVRDLYGRHGLWAGYSIRFQSANTRLLGGIGLAAPRDVSHDDVDEIWKTHGPAILRLNKIFHLKAQSLPLAKQGRDILTRRQRQILELVADGNSTPDICATLNLSTATVQKHMRLAREALGVCTTTQAAVKAAALNQLFVMER